MSTKQNVVAIVYDKRNRILAIGTNSYVKTHPMQARLAKEVGEEKKIFLHAEVAALLKVRDKSKIRRMTVVRYNNRGDAVNARPCLICQKIIQLYPKLEVTHS